MTTKANALRLAVRDGRGRHAQRLRIDAEWPNHGEFVAHVVAESARLVEEGQITRPQALTLIVLTAMSIW